MASDSPGHLECFLSDDWRCVPPKIRTMLTRHINRSLGLVYFERIGVKDSADFVVFNFFSFLLKLLLQGSVVVQRDFEELANLPINAVGISAKDDITQCFQLRFFCNCLFYLTVKCSIYETIRIYRFTRRS